jgi:SAM-dependent methyltransferase
MQASPSANELIAQKYGPDGLHVVEDYSKLNFAKHVRLMRDHMGLRSGTRVLDIGCGTGALLVELAKGGADVTGVDTFEEAGGIDREIAEARMREHGLSIPLRQGTAAELPFEAGAFDIAVSIGMLEHVSPDARRRVLPEMFRVVRPGGFLFLIAGPTNLTPYDQHIPGNPFANWRSRERKLQISQRAGRRQLLEVPWGISRRELRTALPDAEFRNLYGAYFAIGGGGDPGRFTFSPLGSLVWAKRKFHLHRLFGLVASTLYLFHLEHCHILAIRKPSS